MSTLKQRAKAAWRVLFPLTEKQQQKVFHKRAKEQLMEEKLLKQIVGFYVNSVSYNLYSEAVAGDINPNLFNDMLDETVMISGLQGSLKDILTVQIKEAVADGFLTVEDEDLLSQFSTIPLDLTEKGKAYVISEIMTGMEQHFTDVIDKIRAIDVEFEESDEKLPELT